MKTYIPAADSVDRKWTLIDCADQPLGRLATNISAILRGRDRPDFTPHMDTGNFVVAINTAKIKLTGNKLTDKVYWSHSGYPGGIKGITANELQSRHPGAILVHAVKGMLPRNRLSRKLLRKLKVYPMDEHPHQAQLSQDVSSMSEESGRSATDGPQVGPEVEGEVPSTATGE